jgi:hypothetical protein
VLVSLSSMVFLAIERAAILFGKRHYRWVVNTIAAPLREPYRTLTADCLVSEPGSRDHCNRPWYSETNILRYRHNTLTLR